MQLAGQIIFALACWTITRCSCDISANKNPGNVVESFPSRVLAELFLTASPITSSTPSQIPIRRNPKIRPERFGYHDSKFDPVADGNVELDGVTYGAVTYADFEEALGLEPMRTFEPGDIVTGTVIKFTPTGDVFVELKGAKSFGLLPRVGLSLDGKPKGFHILEEGQEIQVEIVRDGARLLLSRRNLVLDELFEKIKKYDEEGTVFNCEVVSVNRGGILVTVEGLTGFIPGSHVLDGPADANWEGRVLPVKVLNYDREAAEGRKLTLSNKKAAEEKFKKILANLKPGTLVEGVITGKQPYGCFVTLKDGPNGLLHVTQISKGRVSMEEFPLGIGDAVKVVVMSVDTGRARAELSTKVLEAEPGDMMRDPQIVFANAEKAIEGIVQKMAEEEERKKQESEMLLKIFDDADFEDPL